MFRFVTAISTQVLVGCSETEQICPVNEPSLSLNRRKELPTTSLTHSTQNPS